MVTALRRPRSRWGRSRVLAGRAGWNIADQVVSSGTNMALSILVARELTADGFGDFAVAFTVYVFLNSAARAVISQPLAVRYTARSPTAFSDAARAATGAATLLGLLSGAATTIAGLAIGGGVGVALLCIGLLMPGLLLQDMWRAVFVTQGRPSAAFVNDVVWGVVQFAAVGAVILAEQQSAATMLIAWGGAALLASLVGGFQMGAHPRFGAALPWLRQQRDLLGYYAATFLAVMGASQLALLLIGGLGEPADVGAIRAAQVIFGPVNLLHYSMLAFAVPEISRRRLPNRTARTVAWWISLALVCAALAWGAAVMAMPDALGQGLLGDTWDNAQAVLPGWLLNIVAIGLGFGAHVVLTARGHAREAFLASIVLAPGFLVFGLLGLHLGGAAGAAYGFAAAQLVHVPVIWGWLLVLTRRDREDPSTMVDVVLDREATDLGSTPSSAPANGA